MHLKQLLTYGFTVLFAFAAGTGAIFAQVVINEVCASNSTTVSDHDGEFADWIELFNDGEEPANLEGYCLSDDSTNLSQWCFPQYVLQPGSYLLLFASGKDIKMEPALPGQENRLFHTNFRLDADGDSLYLTDPGGTVVDSLVIEWQAKDHSFGRMPVTSPDWYLFETPTPGAPNHTRAYIDYMHEQPHFSKPGGRFESPFQLSLYSNDPEDSICFTTDGSEPGRGSQLYNAPIHIAEGKVVKAVILKEGYLPVRPAVHTYIPGTHEGLPVICISTDPRNLWDHEYGIYVMGPNAEEKKPHFGANFWEDWERQVHLEFYEESDQVGFSIGAGMKIFGGHSRSKPQKSLSLFARAEYGDKKLIYQLFPDVPIYDFEAFVLRNSGNEWFGTESQAGTMFRDLMMTRLAGQTGIEYQKGRQAVVYINGEYWGIHNIREKVNEHFLQSNTGVDSDRVDLLVQNKKVIIGSNKHYTSLINFINSNDLRDENHYNYVSQCMDINSFIHNQVAQIYIHNTDWPSNNNKYWRPDYENGRWRWILYDTDFGFGLWDRSKVYQNTLEFATDPDNTSWPNPAWSTLMLRKLLTNESFKNRFINAFADQINTTYQPQKVNLLIDQLQCNIAEEMVHHIERWGGSYETWMLNVNDLKNFSLQRPEIMRSHLVNFFNLAGTYSFHMDVAQVGWGNVGLNTLILRDIPWTGTYFRKVPVKITAFPNPGFRFSHWSGSISSPNPTIQVAPGGDFSVTAHFTEDPDYNQTDYVKVNEISYNPDSVHSTGDWIELVNRTDQYVDLSGWSVWDKSDANNYMISEGTVLKPYGYHLVCRDKYSFRVVHADLENFEGNFNFGLSSEGDRIRLYNRDGVIMSYVSYQVSDPWPVIAPGSGYTLALISPEKNGLLSDSWSISEQRFGTPGKQNFEGSVVVEANETIGPALTLRNYPNPFSQTTAIEFYSDRYQHIRITAYELNGRVVDQLVDETHSAGYHTFSWSPSVPAGIYILKLETPQGVYTNRIVKIE
jgi:hypothetical protein